MIRHELPAAAEVTLEIFSASGSLVRTLPGGRRPAGSHEYFWNGRDDRDRRLPAGVYFTRIRTAAGVSAGRLVIAPT